MPTIWVDADATPKAVREIICKAAIRTEMTTRFVANHRVPVTPHPCITSHQVEPGFDVADNYIAQEAAYRATGFNHIGWSQNHQSNDQDEEQF